MDYEKMKNNPNISTSFRYLVNNPGNLKELLRIVNYFGDDYRVLMFNGIF